MTYEEYLTKFPKMTKFQRDEFMRRKFPPCRIKCGYVEEREGLQFMAMVVLKCGQKVSSVWQDTYEKAWEDLHAILKAYRDKGIPCAKCCLEAWLKERNDDLLHK